MNTNKTKRCFHSCFAIDVQASGTEAVITDSTRCRWHVDLSDEHTRTGFKTWLQDVFLAGISQTLTVFEYETHGNDEDISDWIIRFCNHNTPKQLNEG